jgi:hypothetical protein
LLARSDLEIARNERLQPIEAIAEKLELSLSGRSGPTMAMRKVIRVAGMLALAALVVIQLVPVDTSNPPVTADVPAGPPVKAVLRRACYDCHSNETTWPWYSRVAPVSWLVARDVREGRAELNFSVWDRYTTQQQVKKLKESWEQVAEGEMPPWFYLPAHRDVPAVSRGSRPVASVGPATVSPGQGP